MTSTSALEELASYVPALILRRMAVDSAATLTPNSERFPAAVLMADLSGFTALTERFAHANPAGAEELTQILDLYFGHLVSMVTAHGGDVVKFAGDGLLALWYGDEPLEILTQRAVQCGLAVQMVMAPHAWGGFGNTSQTAELKVRVGVGAGEIATMHVGGVFGRWELLIAGDPLRQAGIAEAQAQPGEALIAPDAWPLVADTCIGTILPSGHARLESLAADLPLRALALPPIIPPMADALRAYIPRAVLTRVDADQMAWIAEQRRVTVLFIHLPDLRADTPLRRAQALMRALQTNLYRYEGSISRLGADSKGPTLMAAFGLPPLAHEDDPLRALRAALDIQAALAELDFACSIGITTGQALCGAVGGAERREYTMMGPVVNHAARFMQAAVAQTPTDALPVVCDAATYSAAHTHVAFESLPSLRLKGVSDPVPAFRPLRAVAPGQPPPAPGAAELIGRERELALLTTLSTRLARRETGGIVLIEGEAGIGKTRLLNQARALTAAAGITTLHSAALPIAGAPYAAWRPILLALLADGAEWPTPPQDADLAASSLLADPELQRLLPLLSAVLAGDLPDTPFTAQMTGPMRADNTRELLVQILERAAARRPFLLALDDAQWLDAGSWALLRAVLARRPSIAFIVALRPIETPPAEYQRLAYHTDSARLTIRGLNRSALQQLIAERLGARTTEPGVVDLIAARTHGNPLFSAELALALHEAQVIQIRDTTAHLAAQPHELERTIAALRLPETVHGLITSRIDRLGPAQQLTLKVAGVIGPSFTLSDLAAIHPAPLPPERLSEHLFQLQQAGLIALEAFEPELVYAFQPAMVAEVAYNLMSFAQRRRLHADFAERLERQPGPDAVLHFARLAHHWQAAGESVRARASLGQAGEAALRIGAYREALGFFTGALHLAETSGAALSPETRARWERQLGEVYHNSGRLVESHELLTTATRRLGWPFPEGRRALTGNLLRAVGIQFAHRLGLHRPYRLSNPAQRREASRAYATIAQLAYYENQLLPALYAVLHSLNLAETIPPSPELATAYAGVQLALGATPLARVYQRLAQRTAQALGHLPSLAWLAEVHALNAVGRADWRHARAAAAYGTILAAAIGDQRRHAECLALVGLIHAQTGAHAAAAEIAAQLYELGLRNADVQVQTWGLVAQAENLLHLGDEPLATALLSQAETLLTENFGHAQAEELWVYGLMAWAALQRGDTNRARGLATAAVGLGGPLPPTAMYALGGYIATAEVTLALMGRSAYTTRAEARAARALAQRACLMLGYLALLFPLVRPAARRAWHRLIGISTPTDA